MSENIFMFIMYCIVIFSFLFSAITGNNLKSWLTRKKQFVQKNTHIHPIFYRILSFMIALLLFLAGKPLTFSAGRQKQLFHKSVQHSPTTSRIISLIMALFFFIAGIFFFLTKSQ